MTDSMKSASKGSTGPKFTGKWKGTDKGPPGDKMVGSCQESIGEVNELAKLLRQHGFRFCDTREVPFFADDEYGDVFKVDSYAHPDAPEKMVYVKERTRHEGEPTWSNNPNIFGKSVGGGLSSLIPYLDRLEKSRGNKMRHKKLSPQYDQFAEMMREYLDFSKKIDEEDIGPTPSRKERDGARPKAKKGDGWKPVNVKAPKKDGTRTPHEKGYAWDVVTESADKMLGAVLEIVRNYISKGATEIEATILAHEVSELTGKPFSPISLTELVKEFPEQLKDIESINDSGKVKFKSRLAVKNPAAKPEKSAGGVGGGPGAGDNTVSTMASRAASRSRGLSEGAFNGSKEDHHRFLKANGFKLLKVENDTGYWAMDHNSGYRAESGPLDNGNWYTILLKGHNKIGGSTNVEQLGSELRIALMRGSSGGRGVQISEGKVETLEKKYDALRGRLDMAREKRRATSKSKGVQGPTEMKIQSQMDKISSEIWSLKRAQTVTEHKSAILEGVEDELPDIGDKIITRKGGQNQGVVVDIGEEWYGSTYVEFKHANGKTYRTPLRNVKVLEKAPMEEDIPMPNQQVNGQAQQPVQPGQQQQPGQTNQTPQQQQQAAAGLAALKNTTNSSGTPQQLAQTLDKAASGASLSSSDTKQMGGIMQGIAGIAQDPSTANQFGQLVQKTAKVAP